MAEIGVYRGGMGAKPIPKTPFSPPSGTVQPPAKLDFPFECPFRNRLACGLARVGA